MQCSMRVNNATTSRRRLLCVDSAVEDQESANGVQNEKMIINSMDYQ